MKTSTRNLALFVLLVLITILGLLYITISKKRSDHKAIKKVIQAKVPTISESRLENLSTVLHAEIEVAYAEIEVADRSGKDRVNELLVAIEQSPTLKHALVNIHRSELEEKLFREELRSIVDWFLSTEAPSLEERREIEGQIDQIVSMAIEVGKDMFPGWESKLTEHGNLLKNLLLRFYTDPLVPTLKRPLSAGDVESVYTRLEEARSMIEVEFGQHIFGNDAFTENNNKEFLIQTAVPRLFSAISYTIGQAYMLPPTDRAIKLEKAVQAEWAQRAQVEAERQHRISTREAQRIFTEQRELIEFLDFLDMAQFRNNPDAPVGLKFNNTDGWMTETISSSSEKGDGMTNENKVDTNQEPQQPNESSKFPDITIEDLNDSQESTHTLMKQYLQSLKSSEISQDLPEEKLLRQYEQEVWKKRFERTQKGNNNAQKGKDIK